MSKSFPWGLSSLRASRSIGLSDCVIFKRFLLVDLSIFIQNRKVSKSVLNSDWKRRIYTKSSHFFHPTPSLPPTYEVWECAPEQLGKLAREWCTWFTVDLPSNPSEVGHVAKKLLWIIYCQYLLQSLSGGFPKLEGNLRPLQFYSTSRTSWVHDLPNYTVIYSYFIDSSFQKHKTYPVCS